MAKKSFKNNVLDAIAVMDVQQYPVGQWRDKSFEAIANGIYSYLTNVDNFTIACPVTGTVTPPVPPAPFSGAAAVSLTYPPASTIKTLLLARPVLVAGDVSGILRVIGTLVVSAAITGWVPEDIGELSGAGGVVSFPLMLPQSLAATLDMQSTKPGAMVDAWALIGKHVVLGLAGTITAIPCSGTVGAPTFAGA